ncbi:MAG: hypothetical protein R6U40_13920 [Desulfobacterales bacterium]
MENEFSTSSFESGRRPSLQRHRREKIWQILVPLILGVLLILAVAVLVVLTATRSTAGGPVSQWADTSAIWLILPVMMFAVVGTLVLIGLIYGVAKMIEILPPYANLVQGYAGLIAAKVKLITRKIVNPIIAVESTKAGVKGFISALFGSTRH